MTLTTTTPDVAQLLQHQRSFFATGQTRSLEFRRSQLQRLRQAILAYQDDIIQAAGEDLGRPEFEAYIEMGVIGELDYVLKKLSKWMQPRKVQLSLSQLPGSAWVQPEPLGSVLIIGPWNYPFQLIMAPLMGAMAAGNCAVLKPSEFAPMMSQVLTRLVRNTFDPTYVAIVEGGIDTAQALLSEPFDHILFTGGGRVGKLVMQAAAEHLTPVTLELGGKSPCIVDVETHIEVTARRIVWGKFLNAGQTCIAPDYLLVHEDVKPALVEALVSNIKASYGEDPAASPDFSRIVNERQFDRLKDLLDSGDIVVGGQCDLASRYIAPTIIDNVSWDAPIMQEEIFGPLLPILTYRHLDDAIQAINRRPKPLALYLFSHNERHQKAVLAQTSSGTVGINEVILQVAIWELPFGGVGGSGMGAYRGRHTFETFSHLKGVLKKPFWLDLKWRYAPYEGKIKLFKKVIGLS